MVQQKDNTYYYFYYYYYYTNFMSQEPHCRALNRYISHAETNKSVNRDNVNDGYLKRSMK